MECGILIGRSRGEVRRMLGPAADVDARGHSYLLGKERGALAMDSEYLVVVFGPDDRVRHAEVNAG